MEFLNVEKKFFVFFSEKKNCEKKFVIFEIANVNQRH